MPLTLTTEWPSVDPCRDDPAVPGQTDWGYLIPFLHRALANPAAHVPFPRFDRRFGLGEACAYWEAAIYLMVRLVGWTDPGTGLQWWYSQGHQTFRDPRLALLKAIWLTEGQLDYLAAWAWTSGGDFIFHRSARPARRLEDFLGRPWAAAFRDRIGQRASDYGHNPYQGGGNPLHLGHSLVDEGVEADSIFLVSASPERRAVLMVEAASAWHSTLAHRGARLPPLGDRSWHVDVVVKPLGWLEVVSKP